ncbi:MAG TPA: arylamine N-acetyltransferase [Polyangiales bacterium]|jgi:N-hydroxyarylamine O-acetyltransferase
MDRVLRAALTERRAGGTKRRMETGTSPNLDAYFRRIGYVGSREPSLATLTELQRRHTVAIPFENMNPLLGLPVRLDVASLERKLVDERRGGYCFEQNGLFMHVLRALGYELVGLAARVTWNQADDAPTARSHMLLRLTIDRCDYIADVGFGAMVLTNPLRLVADVEQSTSHEPFRLAAQADELKLQVKLLGVWKTLYRFDLTPQLPIDYELANYYIATHPGSHFVQNLMVARTTETRRYALLNNELSTYDRSGRANRRVLADASELRAALEGELQLHLPESAALTSLLTRLTGASHLSG